MFQLTQLIDQTYEPFDAQWGGPFDHFFLCNGIPFCITLAKTIIELRIASWQLMRPTRPRNDRMTLEVQATRIGKLLYEGPIRPKDIDPENRIQSLDFFRNALNEAIGEPARARKDFCLGVLGLLLLQRQCVGFGSFRAEKYPILYTPSGQRLPINFQPFQPQEILRRVCTIKESSLKTNLTGISNVNIPVPIPTTAHMAFELHERVTAIQENYQTNVDAFLEANA